MAEMLGFERIDSSFAPRVTSIIPNKKPFIVESFIPKFESSGKRICDTYSRIFNFSKTSEAR